jgi:hypothetical protein
MKNFLIVLLKGMGFILILSISSFAGILKGIWVESDRLARLWEAQLEGGSLRFPPTYGGTMYWIIRIFAFALMCVYIEQVSVWLTYLIFIK